MGSPSRDVPVSGVTAMPASWKALGGVPSASTSRTRRRGSVPLPLATSWNSPVKPCVPGFFLFMEIIINKFNILNRYRPI